MPGLPARRDGYRPRIGGPYKNRLTLTRGEYKVLLEMFNHLVDIGVKNRYRDDGKGRHQLKVKPFIAKLLKMGLRCGYTKVPKCYTGPELH
jgi:hypothetical protein